MVLPQGFSAMGSVPGFDGAWSGALSARLQLSRTYGLEAIPSANPALVSMFKNGKRAFSGPLWAGAAPGQFLQSAAFCTSPTANPALWEALDQIVSQIVEQQQSDGYLGPWPEGKRRPLAAWGSRDSKGDASGLDGWGSLHLIKGLLAWWEQRREPRVLLACEKLANWLLTELPETPSEAALARIPVCELAVAGALASLSLASGRLKYVRAARSLTAGLTNARILKAIGTAPANDPTRAGADGLEAMCALMDIYHLGGDEPMLAQFTELWWEILKDHRNPMGGIGSGSNGDATWPSTVDAAVWARVCRIMLERTGDVHAANELELNLLNATFAAQGGGGQWWASQLPADGKRVKPSAPKGTGIAGGPDLDEGRLLMHAAMESVNRWALTAHEDTMFVNLYWPGTLRGLTETGELLEINIQPQFPGSLDVELTMTTPKQAKCNLALRIPGWAKDTQIRVNGRKKPNSGIDAGYMHLPRTWKTGDVISITFEDQMRVLPMAGGGKGPATQGHLFWGPMLLAYDSQFNTKWQSETSPNIRAERVVMPTEVDAAAGRPLLSVIADGEGGPVSLIDYASAGHGGSPFQSTLPFAKPLRAIKWSKTNPMCVSWAGAEGE